MACIKIKSNSYKPFLSKKKIQYDCDYNHSAQPCWGKVKRVVVKVSRLFTSDFLPEREYMVWACEGHNIGIVGREYKKESTK